MIKFYVLIQFEVCDRHKWALHVPLGKLYTERLVPVDDSIQHIVYRLRFLPISPS